MSSPIAKNIIAIFVSFFVYAGVLYYTKPSWISKVSATGVKKVRTEKLLLYSTLFALSTGLIIALFEESRQIGANVTKPAYEAVGQSSGSSRRYNMGCGCGSPAPNASSALSRRLNMLSKMKRF